MVDSCSRSDSTNCATIVVFLIQLSVDSLTLFSDLFAILQVSISIPFIFALIILDTSFFLLQLLSSIHSFCIQMSTPRKLP